MPVPPVGPDCSDVGIVLVLVRGLLAWDTLPRTPCMGDLAWERAHEPPKAHGVMALLLHGAHVSWWAQAESLMQDLRGKVS